MMERRDEETKSEIFSQMDFFTSRFMISYWNRQKRYRLIHESGNPLDESISDNRIEKKMILVLEVRNYE